MLSYNHLMAQKVRHILIPMQILYIRSKQFIVSVYWQYAFMVTPRYHILAVSSALAETTRLHKPEYKRPLPLI